MKNVILVAILFISITTLAQEKETKRTNGNKYASLTSEQKIELQVKKMAKDLNLTEQQITEFRSLVTKQVAKREKKKATLQDFRNKKITELQAEIATNKAEMKKILNAEQFAKWEVIQQERKNKVKEKMAKVGADEPINKPAEEK